jgi:lipoprotein-releasing system ATP-binding protein
MSVSVLRCLDLEKAYREGEREVPVLRSVSLDIKKGQKIAIVGASGSGKSTLLNLLGGLDNPDKGEVWVEDHAFSKLDANKRGAIRNKSLGFVYQFHHLLPEFTAAENVAIPMRIGGMSKTEISARVASLLEQVGLEHRLTHKPSELSGGERQRVAIARSLAMQPSCVLLDEPTGNLDKGNADKIHDLINQLNHELETSFVIVTHDSELASAMDYIYRLEDGILADKTSTA